MPGISANLPRAGPGPCIPRDAASKPLVYGCRGLASTSAVTPSSTVLPAYMTMTRSAISATTPRSWLINRIDIWSSRCNSRSRLRIFGSQASAMAIMTRWRMPPDIWWGYSSAACSGSGSRTRPRACSACRRAALRSRFRWAASDSWICLPTVNTGLSDVIGS